MRKTHFPARMGGARKTHAMPRYNAAPAEEKKVCTGCPHLGINDEGCTDAYVCLHPGVDFVNDGCRNKSVIVYEATTAPETPHWCPL